MPRHFLRMVSKETLYDFKILDWSDTFEHHEVTEVQLPEVLLELLREKRELIPQRADKAPTIQNFRSIELRSPNRPLGLLVW